jgi:Tfp pilus assembly protein PilE
MIVARRGFTLVETAVAFGLMAMLIAVCLQMLSTMAAERRAVERRAVAMQEAANVVERIAALPWEQLTPERLSAMDLSRSVQESLPGGVAQVSLEPVEADPSARQIRVEITWVHPADNSEAPVSLRFWAYAPRGGTLP